MIIHYALSTDPALADGCSCYRARMQVQLSPGNYEVNNHVNQRSRSCNGSIAGDPGLLADPRRHKLDVALLQKCQVRLDRLTLLKQLQNDVHQIRIHPPDFHPWDFAPSVM